MCRPASGAQGRVMSPSRARAVLSAEEYAPAQPAGVAEVVEAVGVEEAAEPYERLEGARSRVRGERSRRRWWVAAWRSEPRTEPRLRDTQVVVGGTVVWTGGRRDWQGGIPPIR